MMPWITYWYQHNVYYLCYYIHGNCNVNMRLRSIKILLFSNGRYYWNFKDQNCTYINEWYSMDYLFNLLKVKRQEKEKERRRDRRRHIKWVITCPGRSHNCTRHRHERGYRDAHRNHRWRTCHHISHTTSLLLFPAASCTLSDQGGALPSSPFTFNFPIFVLLVSYNRY